MFQKVVKIDEKLMQLYLMKIDPVFLEHTVHISFFWKKYFVSSI